MFKVIIAGGRDFNDFEKLVTFCDKVLVNKRPDVEVVSGKCRGADTLGESYANIRGFNVEPFPAPWGDIEGKPEWQIGTRWDGTKFWKPAGHVRNGWMADYANALIAFWNGDTENSGTYNMINDAKAKGLLVRVCKYKK